MNFIAISDLQKSPQKTFANTKSIKPVFSHKKVSGGVVSEFFMQFVEENDIVQDFEDWILAKDFRFAEEREAGKSFIEGEKNIKTYTFDEIF